MKRYINILFVISLFLWSCEEVIELKHGKSEPLLVVDGKITDGPGPYQVKLSQTTNFNNSDNDTKVSDAEVVISDDEGNAETLIHKGNGIYETVNLQGAIGVTYTLDIKYGGKQYESSSTLLPISEIDTLIYNFEEKVEDSTGTMVNAYRVVFVAPVTKAGQINYYSWDVYRNGRLENQLAEDIIVSSDEYFGEDIAFEFDYDFFIDDHVRVEMSSITEEVYNYFEGLEEVLDNDGGLFSSPPANPPSNISNGALGVFRASSVTSREMTIRKP